jgi:predicted transcriptional regulator
MLGVMLLDQKDKEALVIDMLNKGHSAREIAKQAHASFTDIKKIRNKLTGEVNEEPQKKTISVSSKAFKLFLAGKSIVQVAIGLDLPTDQVLKIHSDYLVLRNMGRASQMLMENRKNLDAYLKILEYIDGNGIKVKDLNHAVDLAQNIDSLKKEKAQLEYDIDMLMESKKYYEKELDEIKNKCYKIR